MICPKCRFSQPDDIYCALCGVNIEKYAQQKRKRRLNIGVWGAFVALTALAAITFLTSSPKDESLKNTSNGKNAESSALLSHGTTHRKDSRPAPSPKTSRQGIRPERRKLDIENTGAGTLSPKDSGGSLAEEEREQEQITARQWFEEGRHLDDDSDAEVECYLKAIALDPGFAPASFHLAAIYFRQAKYDMADTEFTHFLTNASDEDKKNYDIYEYYSLADVERLSEKIASQDTGKSEKKDTGAEQEKSEWPESMSEEREEDTTGPGSENTGQDTDEEVMTVVSFSQANGQIIVPVVLNNTIHAKVLVDTGAGITVLSLALAHELGLYAEVGRGVTLKTMAADVEAQLAKLDSIQVGNINRYDFPVAIADLPLGGQSRFEGILGMDFMNHYTIHIDNEKNRISLKHRKPYGPS